MFGRWGRRGRTKKAVEALVAGTMPAVALAQVPEAEHDDVVLEALNQLDFADETERALQVGEAFLAMPGLGVGTILALEDLYARRGDSDRVLSLCERATELAPEDDNIALRFAHRLSAAGRPDEALEIAELIDSGEPLARLVRGEALLGLERTSEGLQWLHGAQQAYESLMKHSMSRDEWDAYNLRFEDARQLADEAQARLMGAESVVVESAVRGRLDARSANNYALLAESLMTDATYRPSEVRLRAPNHTLTAAKLDLARDEADAAAWARQGEALLRLGKTADAKRSFEKATERDGSHFAGFRGIAAAMRMNQYRLGARVERLPPIDPPPELAAVVPDFDILTRAERRVVLASLHPIRRALPKLVEAGMSIRLLPIDVRTVDLPEWQTAAGARFEDDHRAMAAVGGVASHRERLAASRIEDLLDIASEDSWVFGHELAHLAFFVMADPIAVLELYERALRYPHVAGTYQMQNEHEFFAVAYQDYLRQRYEMPTYREPDEEGIWDACVALFDGLDGSDAW